MPWPMTVWNAPFNLMGFPTQGKDPTKKWLQALLQAFGSIKYKASECIFITMSDS